MCSGFIFVAVDPVVRPRIAAGRKGYFGGAS
jgi:hypothetical protein